MGRKKSPYTLLQRLHQKYIIDDITDCWHFTGAKNNIGYGMIRISQEDGMISAHKAMFQETNNIIVPIDKVVMHTCESYDCINPNHLVMSTRQAVSKLIHIRGKNEGFNKHNMHYGCCKHCNIFTSVAMIGRWHNDNCKNKPVA